MIEEFEFIYNEETYEKEMNNYSLTLHEYLSRNIVHIIRNRTIVYQKMTEIDVNPQINLYVNYTRVFDIEDHPSFVVSPIKLKRMPIGMLSGMKVFISDKLKDTEYILSDESSESVKQYLNRRDRKKKLERIIN